VCACGTAHNPLYVNLSPSSPGDYLNFERNY